MSDYPYAEIGVHILADTISIFSTETDVFPLKNSEDIPNIISRYCEFIQEKVKKVGIIEKNIENRVYQANSVSIAVCKDIDAFALMNHDHLQVHTLIAVIDQDGLRSAVVINNKLFPGGNIANLKNQDSAVAISTLLNLFGPGTVVLSGFDQEKLIPRLRLLVPVGIWNHSQIISSDFTLAQCAAKLHYLLYRYKSSL